MIGSRCKGIGISIALALMASGALAGEGVQLGSDIGLRIGENGAVLKDGEPYHGVGINYFSAFNRRLQDASDTSYREGFAALAKHEIPFVRFAACGFWPKDWQLYLTDKAAYFELLDDVIAAANEHDIGLIPSLFWWYACVPDLVGEPMSAWGDSESDTIAFMRRYTEDVVKRYVNSPAIWAWELGNEYSLAADLPNAADHRPWVRPDWGTAASRSDADDMTTEMVVTASVEFAKTVRLFDSERPITPGHSLPRAAAHHMRTEGTWDRDTREQFTANLLAVNPDPNNLISVHIYPGDHVNRFDARRVPYEETIGLCMAAAGRAGKALFVGEFGARDDEEHGGRDLAKRENYAILNAVERCETPLAALWNFDLPHQESFINVSPDNHRSYLLKVLGQANQRIRLCQVGLHKADIEGGGFSGRLLDNEANEGRQGSGFNPLYPAAFPGENLFRGENVGLNFEHIFNGVAADSERSKSTPRKDPCSLTVHSETSASLHWPAEGSAWDMECDLRYALSDDNAIDLEFKVTPTADHFGQGFVAMMWASYMNHTRDRAIHFYGMNAGEEGWVTFGEDTEDGFETGTVACHGVPRLPYEEGADTLNLTENPAKTFLLPFYYGLVDGDGDYATEDDTMAYIMMFDERESVRFAMWNFISNAAGDADTHSPAWDWQFVVRNPEVGKTYGYRARLVYKPFVSAEDVREEYLRWSGAE